MDEIKLPISTSFEYEAGTQNTLQRQTFLLDTITKNISGNAKWRSVIPWYDSQGLTGTALFRGRDAKGNIVHNLAVGQQILQCQDYPRSVPKFERQLPYGENSSYVASKINTDWQIILQLAVRTTDKVSTGHGWSSDVYTQRATANWEYKLTTDPNNPQSQWSGGGAFTEIKTGVPANPSVGLNSGGQKKGTAVYNDLLGPWSKL